MSNRPANRGAARAAQLFCLVSLAASVSLGQCAQAKTLPDSRVASPGDDFAALGALADAMAARLQRVQQRQETLRLSLSSIPEASREEMLAALKKNRQLASAAARLEALHASLAPPSGAATSIADLQKAAAEAQARRDEWVRKQAKADGDAAAAPAGGLVVEESVGDLKPVTVKLVKNRVVPLTGEFFNARVARARLPSGELVPVRVVSRVRDGEAVADALVAGGLVDKLLDKADASKSYLRILVCADSIAAYRLLALHVAKRGFAYSWDTSKDEDIVQRTDGPAPPPGPAPDSGVGLVRGTAIQRGAQ